METTVLVSVISLLVGAIVEATPLKPMKRLAAAALGLVAKTGDAAEDAKERIEN